MFEPGVEVAVVDRQTVGDPHRGDAEPVLQFDGLDPALPFGLPGLLREVSVCPVQVEELAVFAGQVLVKTGWHLEVRLV